MAEKRVFTYTRTYRVELDIPDEELISRAQMFAAAIDIPTRPESVIDALDAIVDIMNTFRIESPKDINIEMHNSKVDERDPGYF